MNSLGTILIVVIVAGDYASSFDIKKVTIYICKTYRESYNELKSGS